MKGKRKKGDKTKTPDPVKTRKKEILSSPYFLGSNGCFTLFFGLFLRIELWNSTAKTQKTLILLSSVYFLGSNRCSWTWIFFFCLNLYYLTGLNKVKLNHLFLYLFFNWERSLFIKCFKSRLKVSSLFFFHLIPLHSLNHFLHCNLGLFFLFHSCYCSFVILSLVK